VRIAIFGGSFNPPHVAHQLVCTYVLATARVDRVLMIPTYKHPFDKQLAPYDDRVAMCERAASRFGGLVEVSRIEAELGGESYTLRTVRALAAARPHDQWVLVIGGDLVAEREKWHGWAELERLVEHVVVGRSGVAGAAVALPAVSSTDVRARAARGDAIDGLVDTAVAEYIRARGLYRG
jgi:nicotinate-nucleotide adenylyltransferase